MENDSNKTNAIIAAADTHVGLVRKANEDSFGYFIDRKLDCAIFAVADGIGGHGNGDVASAICIRILLEEWRKSSFGDDFDSAQAKEFFRFALSKGNQKIFEINNRFSFRYPMGTTVVAGIITRREVIVVHIGDSRFYRFNDTRVSRITEDHSFVAEMVKNKIITAEEALTHPFSHIISRSIGPNDHIEPDFSVFERCPGDKFMLCSDGVTNYLSDLEIQERFLQEKTPQSIVGNMLKFSLKRGGEDNITLVCVFI